MITRRDFLKKLGLGCLLSFVPLAIVSRPEKVESEPVYRDLGTKEGDYTAVWENGRMWFISPKPIRGINV